MVKLLKYDLARLNKKYELSPSLPKCMCIPNDMSIDLLI